MARVEAPLMSLKASGSLGGAIVFGTNKGRNVVRTLVTPSNPRSAGQVATRAMMRFLTQAWRNLSPTEQGGWLNSGQSDSLSDFNGYVRYDMNRWTQFLFPLSTPTSPGNVMPSVGTPTATGGVRQIQFDVPITTQNDGWLHCVFLDLATITNLTKSTVKLVFPLAATGQTSTGIIAQLAPGTYHWRMRHHTKAGNPVSATSDATVVVT